LPNFDVNAKELYNENVVYQLSEKIKIRKIKKEELVRIRDTPYLFMTGESANYISLNTFVFEIDSGSYSEAHLLMYKTLLAMRLYKEGDVFCKNLWMERNSEIVEFWTINPPVPWRSDKYVLYPKEVSEVIALLEKINLIDLPNNPPFRIACERFSRFYEERRIDDIIIDLAIAFEALFTGEKTSRNVMGELVGLGCSMLLGENAEERRQIFEFLKETYKLRNKIVHGSSVPPMIKVNDVNYSILKFSIRLKELLRLSIKKLIL
jgi:hypothetical protein